MNNGPLCVAVINLKGGVGKTTIAALLGRHAVGALGLKVLAVDLDPQANLSQAYMRRTYRQFISSSRPSMVEVFSGMHPAGTGEAVTDAAQDRGRRRDLTGTFYTAGMRENPWNERSRT